MLPDRNDRPSGACTSDRPVGTAGQSARGAGWALLAAVALALVATGIVPAGVPGFVTVLLAQLALVRALDRIRAGGATRGTAARLIRGRADAMVRRAARLRQETARDTAAMPPMSAPGRRAARHGALSDGACDAREALRLAA